MGTSWSHCGFLVHGDAILQKQLLSPGKRRIGRNVPEQTRVSQSLQASRLVWQKMVGARTGRTATMLRPRSWSQEVGRGIV